MVASMGSAGSLEVVRAASHFTSRWAGGETTELAISPRTASFAERNFDCRISTATVMQSGPFTRLPGFQRVLYLLDGAGMELTVENECGKRVQCLQQATERIEFSGADTVAARLLEGASRDFNVIYRTGGKVKAWRVTGTDGPTKCLLPRAAAACVTVGIEGELEVSRGLDRVKLREFDVCFAYYSSESGNEISIMANGAEASGFVVLLP